MKNADCLPRQGRTKVFCFDIFNEKNRIGHPAHYNDASLPLTGSLICPCQIPEQPTLQDYEGPKHGRSLR